MQTETPTDHWNDANNCESELAFIVDMDAQFIFVPKSWIKSILMMNLATACANVLIEPDYTRNGFSFTKNIQRYYRNKFFRR